ncbi:MAG: NAD(P)/FAD-dependent oxidoreductase [Verrucomicrobiota bacterium]
MASKSYDCVIAGGGPAGTATGIRLAEAGMSVLIVEKKPFPRFHIGESLIPAANRMLKNLGVWDQIESGGFVRKYGAEFCYGDGTETVHNVFADGLVPGYEYTYQVERSRFDKILLDRASSVGCEVLQPVEIKSIDQLDDRWELDIQSQSSSDHRISANWFLDATGRSCLLGKELTLKRRDFDLPKRFAVFNHFFGVNRHPGSQAGNIIIVRVAHGWFWSIPLDEERTSVGLVTTRNEFRDRPEAVFRDAVENNPFMRGWMKNAEAIDDFRCEVDYSYYREQSAGKNWMLLGDAAGFIDPVFSSGVYLALESASVASELLTGSAQARGSLSLKEQRQYHEQMQSHLNNMLELVTLFYDDRAFAVFMKPKNVFQLFAAVNSVIAGHTENDRAVRWRFALFRAICRLNRRVNLVPSVSL